MFFLDLCVEISVWGQTNIDLVWCYAKGFINNWVLRLPLRNNGHQSQTFIPRVSDFVHSETRERGRKGGFLNLNKTNHKNMGQSCLW